MQNWKSQCLKKENDIKAKFHTELQKIRRIKEAIKEEKSATVHKNKEIKNTQICRHYEELSDLSTKAEKSINLVFQLYKKFRDTLESLSSSEIDSLKYLNF